MSKYSEYKKQSTYYHLLLKQVSDKQLTKQEAEKIIRGKYEKEHSCVRSGHVDEKYLRGL